MLTISYLINTLKVLLNMKTIKKVKCPLTNIVVYDLETFKKIRAVPYCRCIYKLSKISCKYHRDISEQEYQKCLNDCVVFEGTDCINEMLDHVLSFKGEPKKVKKMLDIIFFDSSQRKRF